MYYDCTLKPTALVYISIILVTWGIDPKLVFSSAPSAENHCFRVQKTCSCCYPRWLNLKLNYEGPKCTKNIKVLPITSLNLNMK